MNVGVRISLQVLSAFQGGIGTAACNDGRSDAASSEPPPPMECPDTASRLASIRERTELSWVR